jgi:hypothetical protein
MPRVRAKSRSRLVVSLYPVVLTAAAILIVHGVVAVEDGYGIAVIGLEPP